MFYCPYANVTNHFYRAMQINSLIRLFHASPNSPAVDVYANGNLIAADLTYKEVSPYMSVPPGNYNITVYPSGEMTNPIIDTPVSIAGNTKSIISVIGTLPNVSLFFLPEPMDAQISGSACVRFIHLSPNAPSVDIKLSDGTTLFSGVPYKNATIYACMPGGTYTFKFSPTGTDNAVLTVPDVQVTPHNFYSIYVVGLVGESPPLEAVVLPEPRQ